MQKLQHTHVLENAEGLRWLPHSLLCKSSATHQSMHQSYTALSGFSVSFLFSKNLTTELQILKTSRPK